MLTPLISPACLAHLKQPFFLELILEGSEVLYQGRWCVSYQRAYPERFELLAMPRLAVKRFEHIRHISAKLKKKIVAAKEERKREKELRSSVPAPLLPPRPSTEHAAIIASSSVDKRQPRQKN